MRMLLQTNYLRADGFLSQNFEKKKKKHAKDLQPIWLMKYNTVFRN